MLPAVASPPGDPRAQSEETARTIGDVLYRNAARAPVPQSEWIALVQAVAAGDEGTLHALCERTHRLVFTLMVRITGNRATAEELRLDVFHDVWRRASAYDPRNGSVVGLIMTQARSRAIDRVRFALRKKRVDPHADAPDPAPAAPGPHAAFDLREQGRLLRQALTDLTPQE